MRVSVDEGTVIAGAWDLSTRDGSITLRLPRPLDAVLEASTGDGSISSSHPSLTIDSEEGRRRREVSITAGAGGPTVKLKTGDGSIRIE